MNKTIEQVVSLADQKIPREEVSVREGGGGKKLSYLESHYVIARMNEVFGTMGWDAETVEMRQVNKEGDKPAYVSKVRLSAVVKTEDGGYMKVTKEGYGFGADKSALNPHEVAVKEAESDAFKRAARQFGMSLGLALYSKEQENVAESEPKQTAIARPSRDVSVAGNTPAPTNGDREALNKRITAMSKVVIAKRLKTLDELKADMKSQYGVDSTQALSDTQAKELFAKLEGAANA